MPLWLIKLAQRVPRWSDLRALGQSNLLSLTIFVPFIGALIIFNAQVVAWLTVVPEILGVSVDGPVQAEAQTLDRLIQYYFGLSALGAASFLFTVFCPAEVKRSATVTEGVSAEKDVTTDPRLRILILDVMHDYVRVWSHEYKTTPEWLGDATYPESATALFHSTLRAICDGIELPELGQEGEPNFYLGNGGLDVDAIAETLVSGRLVDRYLLELFAPRLHRFSIDLLALRYMALDSSRFWTRASIGVLYFIGFATLALPTIATFFAISQRSFGV